MTDLDAQARPPQAVPAVLEARGLTKHFAVRRAARSRARARRHRGTAGQRRTAPVVHAVEDVSLALRPAASPRSSGRAARASRPWPGCWPG